MPTVLTILGWKLFFYANESLEPVHIHCRKGDCDAKYWLHADVFDIEAQYEYDMSPRDKREIRKIIFEHFDTILMEWNRWQEKKDETT